MKLIHASPTEENQAIPTLGNKRSTTKKSRSPVSEVVNEPLRITVRGQIWRFIFERYEGRLRVNFRKWFLNQDGVLTPTREGIILSSERLREMAQACLEAADAIANDNAPD